MICFGKTTMLASNDMLRLSCDFSIAYEHSDDEPIAFGTPAYWDDAIWTYCNSGYQVFGVYWKKCRTKNAVALQNAKRFGACWGGQRDARRRRWISERAGCTSVSQKKMLADCWIVMLQSVSSYPRKEQAKWITCGTCLYRSNPRSRIPIG